MLLSALRCSVPFIGYSTDLISPFWSHHVFSHIHHTQFLSTLFSRAMFVLNITHTAPSKLTIIGIRKYEG
jgi:hypothetical protein